MCCSASRNQKLLGAGPSLLEVLTMPGGEDIELDPPKLQLVTKPAELD